MNPLIENGVPWFTHPSKDMDNFDALLTGALPKKALVGMKACALLVQYPERELYSEEINFQVNVRRNQRIHKRVQVNFQASRKALLYLPGESSSKDEGPGNANHLLRDKFL